MRVYVHSASHTYDETAVQIHADDGTIIEVSNNGGNWERREPRQLTEEDRTLIPASPFWEEVPA